MLSQDPATGAPIYIGNITMADATTVMPRLIYAECVDDSGRPAGHQGDWPELGKRYPVRVLIHPDEKEQGRVAVLGFEGQWPYFNVFAASRFQQVATVWLN